MAETFANKLKQTNLASKSNITDFVRNTDFDNKLKNISKTVTSNKKIYRGWKKKKKKIKWSSRISKTNISNKVFYRLGFIKKILLYKN